MGAVTHALYWVHMQLVEGGELSAVCSSRLLPPRGAAVEIDVERHLQQLEQLIDYLVQGRLTQVQAHHVQDRALPKIVLLLLKIRTGSVMSERVNGFFQHILDTTVKALHESSDYEMIHCATNILTDGVNYHFYMQAITQAQSPSCDIDSQSSDCSEDELEDESREPNDSILRAGSMREEASPLYVQNINFFQQIGGFQAVLSRIVREPRLNLTAVKVILRPFIKVRHFPPRPRAQ